MRRWKEVWAAKGTISTSDARWKPDVASLSDGLGAVLRLRPVTFRWKDEPAGPTAFGLIAQEVEPVLPQVVRRGAPEEPMGLNYADLVPVMIRAIQQQQQQALEDRDAQLHDLAERYARLESRLLSLEKDSPAP